ncbi:MAG: hypothetical protein WAL66_14990 [Nitrososphaeraceae archaeon]
MDSLSTGWIPLNNRDLISKTKNSTFEIWLNLSDIELLSICSILGIRKDNNTLVQKILGESWQRVPIWSVIISVIMIVGNDNINWSKRGARHYAIQE